MECYVRKHDKLVRHLDMCIEEVSREYARVTMPITENHKNGMGVLLFFKVRDFFICAFTFSV